MVLSYLHEETEETVVRCHHECPICGTKWECLNHYYSVGLVFSEHAGDKTPICNSWCPNCQAEERKMIDLLFQEMTEVGHFSRIEQETKYSLQDLWER